MKRIVWRALGRTFGFALACLLMALSAQARTLVVEGVVSPAWVERAGKREPLTVGMQLSDKDRITTGERARVMLRMAEGSAVKMGENATLALDNLTEKKNAQGDAVVGGSLDVVKGAFRFTTGVFGKPRAARDVNVKIATITAGIRGTDVWGRSQDDQDVVCLLEGRITVAHARKEFVMDQPLQFFIAPRNAPPKPVGVVDKKQIDEWSEETEIREGQGATRAGGKLRVEIARFADQYQASELQARLRAEGYPAVIDPAGGRFAVSVQDIANAKDRDVLHAKIKTLLGGSQLPRTAPAAPSYNSY